MGLINVNLSAAKVVLCDLQGQEMQIDHPDSVDMSKIQINAGGCFGNNLLDACRYLFKWCSTVDCVPE